MGLIRMFVLAIALTVLSADADAAETNQPPLPTLEDLFKRVLERARQETANDLNFATNYVFVRTRTTKHLNSKGEIKKQETRIRTNDPTGVRISGDSARPARDRNRDTDKAFENEQDEFAINNDLVNRYDFKLIGRELWNARATFVIEFRPKDGKLPERTLKDKFLNKAAGRVWIDEAEAALVKAEMRLTDRVNVGGGLIGTVRKFDFTFERAWVETNLWYTRRSEWQLEGRELFVNRSVEFEESRTEVRRLVSTNAPALPTQ